MSPSDALLLSLARIVEYQLRGDRDKTMQLLRRDMIRSIDGVVASDMDDELDRYRTLIGKLDQMLKEGRYGKNYRGEHPEPNPEGDHQIPGVVQGDLRRAEGTSDQGHGPLAVPDSGSGDRERDHRPGRSNPHTEGK